MADIDIYMVLAEALGITRKEAKVLRRLYGAGSAKVIAEWEVEDKPSYFRHRIVLKDDAGTVVKTSHWRPYRGIAVLDYGGISYRASTEYHDGDLPVNCVFTVHGPREYWPILETRVVSEEEAVGVARGPHGHTGHRCSPFCPEFGRIDTQDYETPNDRPPVKHPPECEHGTKWCTGKGEKHSCR